MLWGWIETMHPEWAKKRWVRWYLRTPLLLKIVVWAVSLIVIGVLFLILLGILESLRWRSFGPIGFFGRTLNFFIRSLQILQGIVFAVLVLLPIPLMILDTWADRVRVSTFLDKTSEERGAILATRGEYIGGHPLLPVGRFLYLSLEGSIESPRLSLLVPQGMGKEMKKFTVPVLEVEKTGEKKKEFLSPEQAMIGTLLTERVPRAWGEKLYFTIDYVSDSGRLQKVLLSSFIGGSEEIQRWSNYIVCAREEALTGETPHGDWESLGSSKDA